MEPDDDWDEIHLPQAIEFHVVTIYKDIFDMFHIPLHYKVQGTNCNKEAIEKYFARFKKMTRTKCHSRSM